MIEIAISAGELSGDMHAAQVARALSARLPVTLFGMGGSNLRAAGMETVIDSESSAGGVMGFFGVVQKLPHILESLRVFTAELKRRKPAALLLVDYPGFNLRLAKAAHELGIPVYYFIIPKMWVWRSGRVKLFQRYITHSFTIFPFEHDWLAGRGFMNDSFVGHPIVSQLAVRPIDRDAIRAELGVQENGKLLAFLPGSRSAELSYHVPVMAQVAKTLKKANPAITIVAPVASTQLRHPIWMVAENAGIQTTIINSLDVMRAADVGLIKSGTSTLEAAACMLPSVMMYKSSAITAFAVRTFIRADNYSLPNIVKPGTMLELTQEQASGERLGAELSQRLNPASASIERAHYQEMMRALVVQDSAADADASPYQRVAVAVLSDITKEQN